MVLIVRLLSHDLHCASPPFPGAIASSTFYSSDAADAPTERVITLAPGAYEIAVSGTNFRTGPASFRLLDLGTAAPLAIGQPVSGPLNPVAETEERKRVWLGKSVTVRVDLGGRRIRNTKKQQNKHL